MIKSCAVVDAFSTGRHLPEELARYGYKVVHVRSKASVPGYFASGFAGHHIAADYTHETLDATAAWLRGWQPDFVLPGSELGVRLADTLAERLGLVGNGSAGSEARRDKHAMAEALRARGVRAIHHLRTDRADEAIDWMEAGGLPEIVIKPVNSATTEDVYFCRSAEQVRLAAASILGKQNITGEVNTHLLAQERIRGVQYTVNAVSCNGRAYVGEVWTYETVEAPGAGTICSHEWLLDGDDPVAVRLGRYLGQALDALALRQGPAHVEIIVDADGPVIVDLGARLQGFMSPQACAAAAGHNHITLTALRYCDPTRFRDYAAVNSPYRRQRQCLCVSLISHEEGIVTGHPGLVRIRALPNFADAIGMAPVGTRVSPTRDLSSTPGIVYLIGDDEEALRRDFAAIRAMSMAEIFALAPVTEV
jgi:biotin carboxylase